jgi:hypothetical protein
MDRYHRTDPDLTKEGTSEMGCPFCLPRGPGGVSAGGLRAYVPRSGPLTAAGNALDPPLADAGAGLSAPEKVRVLRPERIRVINRGTGPKNKCKYLILLTKGRIDDPAFSLDARPAAQAAALFGAKRP